MIKISTKNMANLEKDIQLSIKQALQSIGWFVYKNNLSGVRVNGYLCKNSAIGLADLTAIKGGRVLMLEIKRPKEKQKPDQIEFEKNWKEHGGEYYVLYSIEDLQKIL